MALEKNPIIEITTGLRTILMKLESAQKWFSQSFYRDIIDIQKSNQTRRKTEMLMLSEICFVMCLSDFQFVVFYRRLTNFWMAIFDCVNACVKDSIKLSEGCVFQINE